MEQFFCKTKIISGPGSLQALSGLHIKRLLIVADPYFYQNGTVNHVAHLSKAEAVEVFHNVAPDPSVALAAEGTQMVQTFHPDTILALGGGSAMDCAKAMAYFSGLDLRFIAVPTTSGSGSEVTDFAILTHNEVKHPLVDKKLQPDIAILDSDLLSSLPKKLIAETGFDLISHAVEAWAATGAGMISDALVLEALRTAFSLLPKSYAGDTSARLPLHTAATMAGIAFSSAGLGLCHAMAHALGGEFHIPHGRLNAILLPAVMDVNATGAHHRYADLAKRLGFGTGADSMALRNMKNALIRLRKGLDLPENLQQAGIDPAILKANMDHLIEAALNDACCKTNPVKVEASMVRKVLEAVMGHG
jgi:1-propanol dehydrogenase